MKLYLIAGHHNKDNGATALGNKEKDLTIEFRDLILDYIKESSPNLEVILDNDNDTLSQVINKVNATIHKDDILLDIHFNAFNGKASGTECFIPKISSNIEKEIADEICKFYTRYMQIPNRGVKTPDESARGSLGILKGTGNRILVETCFMDNPIDISAFERTKHILSSGTSEILEKRFK